MFTLYVDGGSRGNGGKNDGHGSFVLIFQDKQQVMTFKLDGKKVSKDHIFLSFPGNTNNEAELKTILIAMAYASDVEIRAERTFEWVFKTDSQLVARLVDGMPKKSNSPHLTHLYTQVVAWLEAHPDSTIQQTPRDEIVSILGH